MSTANDIHVSVKTRYLDNHAKVDEGKFAFAYQVDIRNLGSQPSQLLTRYWLITDGNGKTAEVRGDGVVGKQPTIQPGESFIYTSGAVIDTPVGSMQGFYEMQNEDGQRFKAAIDIFSLRVPNAVN
ncbi:Co2+/Mg2+ efflux protein ApaG [Alteromonas facilis]|uniref:Co2+/Mg2+ efflux protein ApaG n=1 Tax=Alteromonas facilis TaxID=2048004 RepID=UPI000C28BAC5|nr:Co2+/Mg2+ efflux protein ApaG [Alteromonas facilis]